MTSSAPGTRGTRAQSVDQHGGPCGDPAAGGREGGRGTAALPGPVRRLVLRQLLQQSVNYQLVASGLVYPTYYSKLFPELRNALTAAVEEARSDHRGGCGRTTPPPAAATVTSLEAVDDQLVILPKQFRRLVYYLALGAGDIAQDGFLAFLASRDDRLFVISDAHATGLDTITRVDGQTVRLLHPPDDLIFIEACP